MWLSSHKATHGPTTTSTYIPKNFAFLNVFVAFVFNSLFAKYKIPVCHIIWGHTGIGATFRSIMFNSYLFTCKSYGKFQKAKLIMHADSANQKQW